jgi:hypothetical protein
MKKSTWILLFLAAGGLYLYYKSKNKALPPYGSPDFIGPPNPPGSMIVDGNTVVTK